jgi:hypothetical protein
LAGGGNIGSAASYGGAGGSTTIAGAGGGSGGFAYSGSSAQTILYSTMLSPSATALAVGGNGGDAAGTGSQSGNGGFAQATAGVTASEFVQPGILSAVATATATGGNAGSATNSASPGTAGTATASADINGTTASDTVASGATPQLGGTAFAQAIWTPSTGVLVTIGQGNVNNGVATVTGPANINTLTGSGSLTIGSSTLAGSLHLNSSIAPSSQSALTITPNSTLDLNNDEFFINYGSAPDPIATIAAEIQSGFNGGAWNGPGIISSAAQSPTNGLYYGVGYADGADNVVAGLSSGQIEIKYALLGDANLDGVVNGADFSILAANYANPITTPVLGQNTDGWDQGDFNYDGIVNGADFEALAANFDQIATGGTLPVNPADLEALDAFATANGLPVPTFANLPEPATTALSILTSGMLLSRRKRRNLFHSEF